jgi:hypothetical protein
MFIYDILIAIILTETLTELAVKSELFESLRKLLFESENKVLNFIHSIFDCGYCFSVWAAILSSILIFVLDNKIVDFFIMCLIVHRLSNLFHFIMDRVRGQ